MRLMNRTHFRVTTRCLAGVAACDCWEQCASIHRIVPHVAVHRMISKGQNSVPEHNLERQACAW